MASVLRLFAVASTAVYAALGLGLGNPERWQWWLVFAPTILWFVCPWLIALACAPKLPAPAVGLLLVALTMGSGLQAWLIYRLPQASEALWPWVISSPAMLLALMAPALSLRFFAPPNER